MSTKIEMSTEKCPAGKIRYMVLFNSEEPPEEFEIDDKYEISDVIWFPVCAATDEITGESVAIKKIKGVTSSKLKGRRVFRELQFLREYRNPFIMKLKDVMLPSDRNNFDEIYIVTEKMERSLFEFLEDFIQDDMPKRVGNYNIKLIMNQLFRGLQYIHAGGVLHRDIKPANVLMKGMRAKLSDFGHTRQKADRMTRFVGTLSYCAPEYFFNPREDYCEYGASADIWALGCLFSDLLHPDQDLLLRMDDSPGQECSNLRKIANIIPVPEYIEVLFNFIPDPAMLLFAVDNLPHTPEKPLKQIFNDVEDKSAIDLLEKMLVFNPKERISIEDALEHDYMKDITVDVLAKELGLEDSEVEQLNNWSPCEYVVDELGRASVEEITQKLYDLCLSFKSGDK